MNYRSARVEVRCEARADHTVSREGVRMRLCAECAIPYQTGESRALGWLTVKDVLSPTPKQP